MNKYRLVVLLRGDMEKKAREKALADISGWAGKVEDMQVDALGEKKLAYSIKGAQKADYVVMKFSCEPIAPSFLAKLEMQDVILRHLLVRE